MEDVELNMCGSKRSDLHLYPPSSFVSELRETPPHFQIDPPAYLECLSYSEGEEVRKKEH